MYAFRAKNEPSMNEILSYRQMCRREGIGLQKGMVFRQVPQFSVLLMSVRPDAPYPDAYLEDGITVIYRGHDADLDPILECKSDQPFFRKTGTLTENGKFYRAAMLHQRGILPAPQVHLYQKLLRGIWSFNGSFALIDAWEELQERRRIFCFQLEPPHRPESEPCDPSTSRYIPSWIRARVYRRDRGCCVICQSRENLHFDHILPVSKGGSSVSPQNIQLLCGRHNLYKRDRIQ